ncbi:MAG: AAA family ATPase [Nitrospirae bacterium]|uniref:Magnetosome protein Mad29 n=1 Tax=uncultured Nitrospirota bacterium TaxID=170969 RepID=A0A142BTW1_9BACT|nr:magnetosome protein Mad29 [uncultured Nitrospirota bacterium]MBF0343196.1 AAA family ATPase [Nitrospirota bacterium]
MDKQVIAIAGPKGGVGKSTISANLAAALAMLNKKVIAVDLDLGGANLHTFFGIKDTVNLDDFILKKVPNLSSILIDTSIRNLKVVCGVSNIPGISNMSEHQEMRLVREVLRLNAEIILLDLAAGSSNSVVDFLFFANKGILITTPEVNSLIKIYSFIKTSIYKKLLFYFKAKGTSELVKFIEDAMDFENHPQIATVDDLFNQAREINAQVTESARAFIANYNPLLVLNRVHNLQESKTVGNAIKGIARRFLDINCDVLMSISEDTEIRRSLAKSTPLVTYNAVSAFSREIKQLALKLCTG